MIPVLTALVILLGVVALLNLVLILAVIRRLRTLEQTSGRRDTLPVPGTRVGAFQARARDGTLITNETVAAGTRLVVFVSPECKACRDLTGELLGGRPTPQQLLLFVVSEGNPDADEQLARDLGAVGPVAVVRQPEVADAFGGITAYPTLLRVESGVVRAAAHRLRDLPAPEEAALPSQTRT